MKVFQQRLLGIFELDGEGKVLYSSLEAPDGSISRRNAPDGSDFFNDVVRFTNVGAFRRRFELFREDDARSNSFPFRCEYQDGPHEVHVVMARLMTDVGPTSFLIHFRRP